MHRFIVLVFLGIFIQKCHSSDSNCDFLEQLDHNITAPCLKQLHIVCNNQTLSWLMFDASSKFLTSGMSYSNVIDYGNFPECINIDHQEPDGERILGKYCALGVIVANIALPPADQDEVVNKTVINMLNGMTFRSLGQPKMPDNTKDLENPILSKYSACVPDACTPKEVGEFFQWGKIPIFIYPEILPCETKESNTDLETGDIFAILFFALILLLMIMSTAYDAYCQRYDKKPRHEILLAFSILFNGKKILHISNNKTEQIQCFNGMRFISMMWIVAFHAVAPYQGGVVGIVNFPEVHEWDSHWTARYILSALLAVDTFFYIAGFLLAFSYIKSSTKVGFVGQVAKVPQMYLHRYLRLTPSAGTMFLVVITIYRFLGSGPTWTAVTGLFKDTCKEYWWQFFLYIQNYTNPDTMCVNPMWYLSADMQMFILAPLVLIPTALFVRKRFMSVMMSLGFLTILSIIIPMLIRYFVDEAPGNIYTAHERFNNFLIGVMFGTFMRLKKDKPFTFKPLTNVVLWIVAIVVSLAFNIYWHDVLNNYDLVKYTLFMGFYRPVWCICLSFMVYSCYHGHGGPIEWLLSRPIFQILGRLSYSMYVLHVVVELYVGGSLRTNVYFSNYTLFYNWCGHIVMTMVLSVVWVLAFEFPMLTIDKYIDISKLFGGGSKAKSAANVQ